MRPSSLARRTVCGRFALQLAPGPSAGSLQLSGELDGAGAGLCLQHLASEYRVNANASAPRDPVAAGTNPEDTNAWMLWYPLLEARGITPAGAAAMALRPGGTVELVAMGRGRVALPLALNSRTWVRPSPDALMFAVDAPPAPEYTMFPVSAAAASFTSDTASLVALTWGSSPGAAVNWGYNKQDLLAAYADPYAPALAAAPVALVAAANGAASVRGLLLAGPCATNGVFHDADGDPSAPSSMARSEYGCAGVALSWDEGSADQVPADPALLAVRGNHSAVVFLLTPGDASGAVVAAEGFSNAHTQPRAWAFASTSLQTNLPTVQGIVSYAGREGYGSDGLSAPGLRARYVEIELRLRGVEWVVPADMRLEHLVASLPPMREYLYSENALTGAAYECNSIHGSWCSMHSLGDYPDLAWELARNYATKVAAAFREMVLGSGLSPSVFVRDRLARPLQWGGELLTALQDKLPTSDSDGLAGGLRDGLGRLVTCLRNTVPDFLASLTSDVAAASTVTSAFLRTVVAKDGACMLDLLALYTPQEGATSTDYTAWICPAAAGVWNATRDALRQGGVPRPVPSFFASFTGRVNEQVTVGLDGGAVGDVPDSAAADATVDLGLALSTVDGWLADAQRSMGIGALGRMAGPGEEERDGVDWYPCSELATWAVLKASGWDAAPLASSTHSASPSPTPSLSASSSTSPSSTASPTPSASASAPGDTSPDATPSATDTASAMATPSATSSLPTGASPSSSITASMTHTPSSSRSRLPIPTVDSNAVSGGAIPTSSPGVARASVSVAFTVRGLPLEELQRAGTAALRPFLLIKRAFALSGLSTTADASAARNGTDPATPAGSQLTTHPRGVFVNIRSLTDLASGTTVYFSFDDDVNRPGNYDAAAAGGGSRRRLHGASGVTIETIITVDTDAAVSTGALISSVGAVAGAPDLLTSLAGAVAQLAVVANLPADAVTVVAAAVTAVANPAPPSPSPALVAPPPPSSGGGVNVAAIAGGVGGGVAGIALVVAVLIRRRRKITQPRLRVLSSKAPVRGKGPLPSLNPLSAAVIAASYASHKAEATRAAPMLFNPLPLEVSGGEPSEGCRLTAQQAVAAMWVAC